MIPVPEALAAVMDRSAPAPEIAPSLDALRDVVRTHEAQRPATPHNS